MVHLALDFIRDSIRLLAAHSNTDPRRSDEEGLDERAEAFKRSELTERGLLLLIKLNAELFPRLLVCPRGSALEAPEEL